MHERYADIQGFDSAGNVHQVQPEPLLDGSQSAAIRYAVDAIYARNRGDPARCMRNNDEEEEEEGVVQGKDAQEAAAVEAAEIVGGAPLRIQEDAGDQEAREH